MALVFIFFPSPTTQLWSASEMIKTKRILNVWNSLFTTDAFSYFLSLPSLVISPLGRAVCFTLFLLAQFARR